MKNFPGIKDEQRCILEAEELHLFERAECRGQRTGQGRNSLCQPAELWRRGAFLGTGVLSSHFKEKKEKSHFEGKFSVNLLKKP